jgi:hypothetical protein
MAKDRFAPPISSQRPSLWCLPFFQLSHFSFLTSHLLFHAGFYRLLFLAGFLSFVVSCRFLIVCSFSPFSNALFLFLPLTLSCDATNSLLTSMPPPPHACSLHHSSLAAIESALFWMSTVTYRPSFCIRYSISIFVCISTPSTGCTILRLLLPQLFTCVQPIAPGSSPI